MANLRTEILRFLEAEASATAASIVDFGLALGLTYGHVLPYTWSNIIGVVMGGITNCLLNSRYVFRGHGRKKKEIALRYFMVWFGSMCLNGLGTNGVTALLGARWFVVVKCVIAFFVAVGFNYPLQRGFVFRSRKVKK